MFMQKPIYIKHCLRRGYLMSEPFLFATVDKFIFKVKAGNLYSAEGVWVALEEATGTARIGLSDYLQQSSGDVAFVFLPEPGRKISAGQELATLETIKVDLEVPAPIAGEIVAVNDLLEEEPELVNLDCYGRGWLLELKPAQWPPKVLLDAEAYLAVMTEQAQAEAA
jgi:glycine cleavage system H protein